MCSGTFLSTGYLGTGTQGTGYSGYSVLTTVEVGSHKEMNNNQDVPSLRVATPVYVIAKELVKVIHGGKVIFHPQTISANPFSSFPQIPQKDYLRS